MKIIWSNVFLTALSVVFITLFMIRTGQVKSLKNEVSKVSTSTILKEKQEIHNFYKNKDDEWVKKLIYKSDSIKILTDSIVKLQDIVYKYQMKLIKPDTESSYWYVYYETKEVRGYSIVKMKNKCFSLHDAQKQLHNELKLKNNQWCGVSFFYPVSEYAYNEWSKSEYN